MLADLNATADVEELEVLSLAAALVASHFQSAGVGRSSVADIAVRNLLDHVGVKIREGADVCASFS